MHKPPELKDASSDARNAVSNLENLEEIIFVSIQNQHQTLERGKTQAIRLRFTDAVRTRCSVHEKEVTDFLKNLMIMMLMNHCSHFLFHF